MKKAIYFIMLAMISTSVFAGMPLDHLYGRYQIETPLQPNVANIVTLEKVNKKNVITLTEVLKRTGETLGTCTGEFNYNASEGVIQSQVQCPKNGLSFTQTVIIGNVSKAELKKPTQILVRSSLYGNQSIPASILAIK